MLLAFGAQSMMAAYPEKPVTLVIPYKAGGSTQKQWPAFTQGIGEALGVNVVVKTRPGGGGGGSIVSKRCRRLYTAICRSDFPAMASYDPKG